MLALVLGNGCNLDCPHCYQRKDGGTLLHPPSFGRALRQEFLGLYPCLSTLRLQGGEAFAYTSFRQIVDDVASAVDRPILSVSTNGTLVDDAWAERIVRLPFSTVTVSIDGATPETYAGLRRGGDLDAVLANVARIRLWKYRLNSALPKLDSSFVVMRSNFREIPRYLELMHRSGFSAVALQTVEINRDNSGRDPDLDAREVVRDPDEVAELHHLLRNSLLQARRSFRAVRVCGLETLFGKHGLDTSFLRENQNGLHPSNEYFSRSAPFDLCPNPWTTLFVSENGDVQLCWLSEPVGNLHEAPLLEIWNSPRAVAKRKRLIRGQYVTSGCSATWCGWREGKAAPPTCRSATLLNGLSLQ
jgi:MoaA/NifB/PqqE/SkfB family radical SAM enzyme